ncbi:MAG: hypothetical protein R3246_01870 [Acidimicrobiia bacterium]|nr:hypothetical protein [Acidimicrobiia bacterium]
MLLIGERISHSLSPAMWNHYFLTVGSTTQYDLRDVTESELASVLAEVRSGDVVAANVTMPHKGWAASIADEVSDPVLRTGAANLLLPGEVLVARNTDVLGARSILERRAPYRTVLVLGAGGTAAALTEALRGLAEHLLVVNRTRSRAEDLASRIRDGFAGVTVVEWAHRNDIVANADLVISTVPMVDAVPIDPHRLRSHALVYDALYRETPTAFQHALSERAVPVSDGLAHLAAQAISMFEFLDYDPRPELLVEGLEQATGRPVTAWGGAVT